MCVLHLRQWLSACVCGHERLSFSVCGFFAYHFAQLVVFEHVAKRLGVGGATGCSFMLCESKRCHYSCCCCIYCCCCLGVRYCYAFYLLLCFIQFVSRIILFLFFIQRQMPLKMDIDMCAAIRLQTAATTTSGRKDNNMHKQ